MKRILYFLYKLRAFVVVAIIVTILFGIVYYAKGNNIVGEFLPEPNYSSSGNGVSGIPASLEQGEQNDKPVYPTTTYEYNAEDTTETAQLDTPVEEPPTDDRPDFPENESCLKDFAGKVFSTTLNIGPAVSNEEASKIAKASVETGNSVPDATITVDGVYKHENSIIGSADSQGNFTLLDSKAIEEVVVDSTDEANDSKDIKCLTNQHLATITVMRDGVGVVNGEASVVKFTQTRYFQDASNPSKSILLVSVFEEK